MAEQQAQEQALCHPWLVAVWPGMGHVALSAGYYLLAKLGMHALAEFQVPGLFDVDHVDVKDGMIRPAGLPRARLFLWSDPQRQHDIIVFIGEVQPPLGKHMFCHRLLEYARELKVDRVFTFAAMATHMHPQHAPRVFGAATDKTCLAELRSMEVELLAEGHIGGLNGVLLGVAAEVGLPGICLLGEMPHILAQLPFPKSALAVLRVFAAMAGIDVELAELASQAAAMDRQLGEILAKAEGAAESPPKENEFDESEPEESEPAETETKSGLGARDRERIEQLFRQARQDRSKAYELKQELDRLNAFAEYEDRFLDLFKRPG